MGGSTPKCRRREARALRRGRPRRAAEAHWEAYGGMVLVDAGTRRNGKPHRVLMIQTFICLREADAKAVAKATGLQFVKKTESEDGGR